MTVNLKLEAEALESLADLLKRADKTRLLFEQAHVPLPDALQRLFRSSNGHYPSVQTPIASFRPVAPPDAEPDWVWIDLTSATPGTLALALLRRSNAPLTVRDIHEKMRTMNIEVSVGTIANTGTRAYENGIITRDADGRWSLAARDKAGVIHEGHVWGTPVIFQMQELAAYRRHAILYLLTQNPSGLQQAQIASQLRQNELVKPPIPVNKALIKADVDALQDEKKIRRIGNSKKWGLT